MLQLLTVLIILATTLNAELNTITHIKNGALQGKILADRNGREFVSFQSIPYSKVPIGNLRFKAPEPAANWNGVLEATKEPPSCLQLQGTGWEDCLYINVYTPELTNKTDSLKPVMFFVYGGAFNTGSSSTLLYGPEYLLTEDVVLVTFNYRVGALGFLSLDDKTSGISSNNGLKDQVMALKWVQENIAQFGGNPDKVTIFGESAGGASIHFLVLSPMAKDLFHGAIIQSGTAISTWANGLSNTAIPFAKALGIDPDDTDNLLEELQKVSTYKIFQAQEALSFVPLGYEVTVGQPTIEGPGADSFLPDHPRNIQKSGYINQVPIMVGYNNMEGIMFYLKDLLTIENFVYNGSEYIPYYLDGNKNEEIIQRTLDFYFNGIPPTESKDLIDLYTDFAFKYDTVRSVKELVDIGQQNVYFYEFLMDTELNFMKRMLPATAGFAGATHGDDMGYLFHQGLSKSTIGSLEDLCLRKMVKLWTNFAKYGNPTPIEDELLDNQIWLPFKPNQSNYMHLANVFESKTNYVDERFEFWDMLFNDYDVFQK